MSITLDQVLDLIGELDDSPGDDTARERLRRFLRENILEIGQIRDYVFECLRKSGTQYNRVLQDLLNHVGRFLDFEIEYGRYQGTQDTVGFDGLWRSATGFHVVIEVKTTEAYAIKTATLASYIEELISEKRIPSWDDAVGLYIVGRPDPSLRQLHNSIIAEKRTHQLRIISADSLLSLAELKTEYEIDNEDILAILKPSEPTIDPVVDLMARLVAEPKVQIPKDVTIDHTEESRVETTHWITSVKSLDDESAENVIERLVKRERIYALSKGAHASRRIRAGDRICFYASGTGVVAHARVQTAPTRKEDDRIRNPHRYPWFFKLTEPRLYLEKPVIIDSSLRARLRAFEDKDPEGNWSWFVQQTHEVDPMDFELLTGQRQEIVKNP